MNRLIKVVAAVLLAPFVLLTAGIGGCEARKAYYDWQVRRMCEKDGGVTVYERITVSPVEASRLPRAGGFLGAAPEALAKDTEPAFSRIRRVQLREGNLSIVRYETEVIRRSDRRIVGRAVTYTRAGGDFPTFAHPSSFSCPETMRVFAGINAIYQVEEPKK